MGKSWRVLNDRFVLEKCFVLLVLEFGAWLPIHTSLILGCEVSGASLLNQGVLGFYIPSRQSVAVLCM